MDPIQVLGRLDVRKEVQFKDGSGQLLVDKARVKNTLAGDVLEEAVSGVNAPRRYVRGMSKTAKKCFINRKDSPVKATVISYSFFCRVRKDGRLIYNPKIEKKY